MLCALKTAHCTPHMQKSSDVKRDNFLWFFFSFWLNKNELEKFRSELRWDVMSVMTKHPVLLYIYRFWKYRLPPDCISQIFNMNIQLAYRNCNDFHFYFVFSNVLMFHIAIISVNSGWQQRQRTGWDYKNATKSNIIKVSSAIVCCCCCCFWFWFLLLFF